jgi:tetratricopeptide (TPR) repeat protein
MKAARTVLLATALCALADFALAIPALAHNRADARSADLALPATAAPGPCLEPGPVAVAVAGLPTAVKAAGALEERGVSCALAGDLRPAILHFDEAIRRFPWRPQAYANRGQAYAGLGEYEFAVLDYDNAIRLAPGQDTYRYLRAVSLAEIGRAEQAVYDLERVLKLNDRSVVTDLQRYLAIKGYDPGPIDGRYGPSTRRALIFCVSEKCFSF